MPIETELRCPDLSLEKLNSLAITLNSLVIIINKAMTKTCAQYLPDDQTKFMKAAFLPNLFAEWQTELYPNNSDLQLKMDMPQ